mmetsp:Transcript_26352/g.39144  ORF Transcript_26352/g.39144 Transcript_26352/m.39144 type:complete len:660 (-) Transcript_26352:444-2423(-)
MFSPFSVLPEDDLPKDVVSMMTQSGRINIGGSPEVGKRDMTSMIKKASNGVENSSTTLIGALSPTTQKKRHLKKSWLVEMLETTYKPIKQSAVDYLEMLSNLTVVDYILDEHADPTPVDIDLFEKSREEIFSEVERLKYLVPAMISLEDSEKERVAVTLIIQRVLDNAIVQPFGITILFCDLIFHIFLLFGWRNLSFVLVKFIIIGSADRSTIGAFDRFLESMFVISTLYFVWRITGEMFSTIITSWRVFRVNLFTFWTLVDVVSTATAAVFVINIIVASAFRVYPSGWFDYFAVMTGLFWLKLLSFLKVMNPSLATFVLAITQVLKDVLLLLLILAMVTLAFSDMFYTIISRDFTMCPPDEDPDDGNPYCSNLRYLDVFTQILGNFGYEFFLGHSLAIFLFVIMTIFGAVIFLNILIAVVDDSYSTSREKSTRLFGRARILTVAKLNALEQIMKPKWLNRRDRSLIRASKLLFKLLSLGFFGASVYVITMLIDFVVIDNPSSPAYIAAAALILVVVIGSVILISFVITGWGKNRRFLKLRMLNDNIIITWIFWKPMVFIVYLVLGRSSIALFNENSDEHSAEWSDKTTHNGSTMREYVGRSDSQLVETIDALKNRIEDCEKQKAKEIEALKEHLVSQDRENTQQRILLENILKEINNI